MKKILLISAVALGLSACGGSSAPTAKTEAPLPKTETGFYANKSTTIGESFLNEVSELVQFEYDSAMITPKYKEILDAQASFIIQNDVNKILIEGHTDERGTREYNLALGEKRANAVKEYLIERGVDSSKIVTVSYGKEVPLDNSSTPEAWSKNRRAVTVVM